ncbi:NARE ribosyltransferase, partial [Rostratula benghalensis]|nr:NARE ribosyltransferase [Rostratula benghalensis]
MEHLVMGLVLLLAGTPAAGNPLRQPDPRATREKVLDMAPTAFDDQYLGCSRMMEEELGELNRTEFANNRLYAEAWTQAAAEWRNRGGRAPRLRTEQAVAIMAYTLRGRLYQTFNAAVREAGRSRGEYLERFRFKALHFLLTQALGSLREAQPRRCRHVYRGVLGIRFTARRRDLVRFGQFTSTSLQNKSALHFGQDTFFSVKTCYGVPIRDFSLYPSEEEVLIPPYERFEVTNVTKRGDGTCIHLRSRDTFSNYSCEWVKGDNPCDGPSVPWTDPQSPGMVPPCPRMSSPSSR